MRGIPVALYVDFSDDTGSTNRSSKYMNILQGITKNRLMRNASNLIPNEETSAHGQLATYAKPTQICTKNLQHTRC